MEIDRQSGDNWGGIARLYVALQRDMDVLFDFEYDRESLMLTESELEENFSRLRFTLRTAGYDFDEKPGSSGPDYTNTLEAAFGKDREEIRTHMGVSADSKLCFVFRTHNGEWYVLPNAEESTAFHTGKEPKDTNGHTMTWSAVLSFRALPITIL